MICQICSFLWQLPLVYLYLPCVRSHLFSTLLPPQLEPLDPVSDDNCGYKDSDVCELKMNVPLETC